MGGRFFLCYSKLDGRELAQSFADRLIATMPSVRVWLDERELQPGTDWGERIAEALKNCDGVLFLMTADSVHPKSECKHEWTRALSYKKPIIPLRFDPQAEMPFRLEPRQYLDFTGDPELALAQLREHIRWRSSPEGRLHGLKERLSDAERDLPRAKEAERPRIEEEINSLREEIAEQGPAIADSEAATRRTMAGPSKIASRVKLTIKMANISVVVACYRTVPCPRRPSDTLGSD